MKTYHHHIAGEWVEPASGNWIDSVNPASGKAWCRIAQGTQSDADAAVAAADIAFRRGPWASASARKRAELLHGLADLLEAEWETLVEPEVRDNGKRIVEVRAQFSGLHVWYRYFADQMLAIEPADLENEVPGVSNKAHYVPFGVVVAITPWNSPLMIAAWKLAPALAAGNTVVIKPSELASASTLEFARLVSRSNLPAGVINVVTGLGAEIGSALVRNEKSRLITFTGSDSGGGKVAQAAAGGVKPVTLELGGKSPQVVFADADLDNAVNGVLSGIFLSNGQTCVAGSRLIVQRSVHDALVARLVNRVADLKAGDPMDDDTQVAPLANEPHLEKVLSMIAKARREGARCLCGGERIYPDGSPEGFFVAPTIFADVTPSMSLWNEEVFGPVLAVTAFDSEDEAISLANDSPFGLAAGVWTSDQGRAQRLAREIEAGTIYINHYRSVSPGSPIGGFKRSGYGRELGPDAVRDFMQIKSVWNGTLPCADPFPPQAG
ncbi:MAG: aldehyde dehydrogenase [Alphaproteobacteria bacterium]|nr:aldehyde dehydrogenase [Alphaproteobacteria bacterium]